MSTVLSAYVLWGFIDGSRSKFDENVYTWLTMGGLDFSVGFLVDSLTAMMMVVVTSVSLMVHIYTIGYMHDEETGYQRFFSYISLFTFSMLMLVMSNNFVQLFFGWEAVGLVSYLLIGFYFKRESAIFANLKAFLVNRVGDFGFLLGIRLGAGLFRRQPTLCGCVCLSAQCAACHHPAFPGCGVVVDDSNLFAAVYRRDG